MTVVLRGLTVPEAAAEAAAALAAGAVVAVPTDTVYGLAARLDRPAALAAIFDLKGRPPGLALPVLVAGTGQLGEVVSRWPATAERLAATFWPGALTLVVPARPAVGPRLGGDGATVGVRHPRHATVEALCAVAGPLAVTSANRHGAPPCTTAGQVLDVFGGSPAPGAGDDRAVPGLGLVVDGGPCDGTPSTVVDCTSASPVCRRAGAVPWEAVQRVAGGSSLP